MAHSLQHATHVVSGKSTFPPGSKVMIVKYKMGFSFAHERASIRLVLKAPVLPIDAAGTQPFHTATPIIRSVAQLGSALQWGCKGRRFESCRSDQSTQQNRRFRINPSGGFSLCSKHCQYFVKTTPDFRSISHQPTLRSGSLGTAGLPQKNQRLFPASARG